MVISPSPPDEMNMDLLSRSTTSLQSTPSGQSSQPSQSDLSAQSSEPQLTEQARSSRSLEKSALLKKVLKLKARQRKDSENRRRRTLSGKASRSHGLQNPTDTVSPSKRKRQCKKSNGVDGGYSRTLLNDDTSSEKVCPSSAETSAIVRKNKRDGNRSQSRTPVSMS